MATLSVWRFPIPDGAQVMLNSLEDLQKQQLINVQDGAVVTWEVGAKRPKTRQLNNLTGVGALGGAFSDVGIDDKFIEKVRSQITPGTSALFLLSSDAVMDKVQPAIADLNLNPELISTNMSAAQEEKLRETLAEG